jgi:tRNA threonylcarbamoyladenosine modification (KEOPS) complex  Pcc1 subunit
MEAIGPETEAPSSKRSKVSLLKIKDGVKLTIEASDMIALRAALNSYLKWIQGILDLLKKIS